MSSIQFWVIHVTRLRDQVFESALSGKTDGPKRTNSQQHAWTVISVEGPKFGLRGSEVRAQAQWEKNAQLSCFGSFNLEGFDHPF